MLSKVEQVCHIKNSKIETDFKLMNEEDLTVFVFSTQDNIRIVFHLSNASSVGSISLFLWNIAHNKFYP